MLSETKRIGTIGELAIAQDLLGQGWDVYTALGDCTKVDIIAVKDNLIQRHQVKTVLDSSSGAVTVAASKVISRKKVWYNENDFDYLSVYVADRNQVAYVPMSEVFRHCLTLRFDPPKNGADSIRLFSTYRHISS